MVIRAAGMGEDGVKRSVGSPSDHQPMQGSSSSSGSSQVHQNLLLLTQLVTIFKLIAQTCLGDRTAPNQVICRSLPRQCQQSQNLQCRERRSQCRIMNHTPKTLFDEGLLYLSGL